MREAKTVAVISQVDHGKSTLFDTILNHMNFLSKYSIDSQFLDSRKDERMRGITLKLSFLSTGNIDFIDTPGHFDMESLIELSIAIADIIILIVDINDGITIRLQNILEYIGNRPVILCINKIDMVNVDEFLDKAELIERNLDYNIQEIFYTSFKSNYGFSMKIMQKLIEKIGKKCNAKKNIIKFYFQLLENRKNEKLKNIFSVKNDCTTELLPIAYFLIHTIERIPVSHKKNYAYALLNIEIGQAVYTAIKVENNYIPSTYYLKNNRMVENIDKKTGLVFSKSLIRKGNITGQFNITLRKNPIYKKYFYFSGKRENMIESIKNISLTELNIHAFIDQYNRVELCTEGPIHYEKIIFDLKREFSIYEVEKTISVKNKVKQKRKNCIFDFNTYRKKHNNILFIKKNIPLTVSGLINSSVEFFLCQNNIYQSEIFINTHKNLKEYLSKLELLPLINYYKISVECNMNHMGELFQLINRYNGIMLNEKYECNFIIIFKLEDNFYSQFVDELNGKKILAYITII